MTLPWDQFEALVLRWAFAHAGEDTGLLHHRTESAFEDIPSLTQPQLIEAIDRLLEHGLIAARGSTHTIGYKGWSGVRPTADGLRVLGEWPPDDGASVNAAIAHILREMAGSPELTDEQKSAARRAAATVTNLSGDVVLDVMKDEIARLAGGGA